MISDVVAALKSIFTSLWSALQLMTVPGTENLSWGTVLVAPFGFAVFVMALNKVLNMSAHQGVSGFARNTYKKYEKESE